MYIMNNSELTKQIEEWVCDAEKGLDTPLVLPNSMYVNLRVRKLSSMVNSAKSLLEKALDELNSENAPQPPAIPRGTLVQWKEYGVPRIAMRIEEAYGPAWIDVDDGHVYEPQSLPVVGNNMGIMSVPIDTYLSTENFQITVSKLAEHSYTKPGENGVGIICATCGETVEDFLETALDGRGIYKHSMQKALDSVHSKILNEILKEIDE